MSSESIIFAFFIFSAILSLMTPIFHEAFNEGKNKNKEIPKLSQKQIRDLDMMNYSYFLNKHNKHQENILPKICDHCHREKCGWGYKEYKEKDNEYNS